MTNAEAERLRALLEERGALWPSPIEYFTTVTSTNDLVKDQARSGAAEWSLAVADRQTAGRGRHGRAWASPPGSLSLSVLLRSRIPIEAWGLMSLAAGLSVAEGLASFGVDARVKWPNDVLIGERKLAGILAEGVVGRADTQTLVLGVGINVGVELSALPVAVRATATSLRAETGIEHDHLAVAAAALTRLRVWYDALHLGDIDSVLDAWRSRSVPWWGRAVEVQSTAQAVRGVARGVDRRGALLVEMENGETIAVVSGEVRELRLR